MSERVYRVGRSFADAEFMSIQAAIDQAVLDGASLSEPGLVQILPGEYVEDLSIGAFVSLEGMGLAEISVIRGTVAADFSANPAPFVGVGLRNLLVRAPDGAPAINVSGTKPTAVALTGASVEALGSDGSVNFTVSAPGSVFAIRRSSIQVGTGTGRVNFDSPGNIAAIYTQFTAPDQDAQRVLNMIQGNGSVFASELTGQVEVAAGSFLQTSLSRVHTNQQPALVSEGEIQLFESEVLSNDPGGNFATGNGVVSFAGLALSGFAKARASTLGGADLGSGYHTSVPGSWDLPAPTTIQIALDRLAVAVEGLLGGALP